MPWSPRQHRLLQAIEHGFRPSNGAFSGVSQEKAGEMAHEGVRRSVEHARRAHELKKKLKKR